jgi:hypothetical protein
MCKAYDRCTGCREPVVRPAVARPSDRLVAARVGPTRGGGGPRSLHRIHSPGPDRHPLRHGAGIVHCLPWYQTAVGTGRPCLAGAGQLLPLTAFTHRGQRMR